MPHLISAEYGKDNVLVFVKNKDEETGFEYATEMSVCCLLQGQIDVSYTEADNSPVVATDSIKNTIMIKAYENFIDPLELWASQLGQHFLDTYPHINAANIDIVAPRWIRMDIDGKPHPHSFHGDSNEKKKVKVRVTREGIDITTSLTDLSVLKTTGSMFYGFVRDEFTTLPETWDRILSTSVDATWKWYTLPNVAAVQEKKGVFNEAYKAARDITMKTFAETNSPSVQNTMWEMCKQILEAAPDTKTAAYALPNKHYFECDLSWHKGIKNTGKDAKVYVPQRGPNGLIKCEVSRNEL